MLKQCPEQCSDDAPRNPRNETYIRTNDNQDLGDNSPVLNVREISDDEMSEAQSGWVAFVASIDLVKLERERTGIPKASERPGSPADQQMRVLHAERADRFRRGVQRRGDKAALVAEASAWNRRMGREKAQRAIDAARALTVPRLTPRDRLQLAVNRQRAAS